MASKDERRGKDPHLGLRFWVAIDGIEIAGFDECSSLVMETEVFEYAEGGLNTTTHKLPVRTKYPNVTLKRGMDATGDLFRWYADCLDWYGPGAHGPKKRRNVTITVYDSRGEAAMAYHLMNAWPVKWTGPELKASAGAIAVESLEFAHQGLVTPSHRP